jgi:DNA-binding transcriptional ArsR family regulator
MDQLARGGFRVASQAGPIGWLTRHLTFAYTRAILKHVPNQSGDDRTGRVFHALADPTRRAIVERLVRGPAAVKVLAEPLAMSLPAVMQHLQVLEGAGVIVTEKVGRVRSCRIEPTALREAELWLNGQRTKWERQLDQLGDYLKEK